MSNRKATATEIDHMNKDQLQTYVLSRLDYVNDLEELVETCRLENVALRKLCREHDIQIPDGIGGG